jgi:hypothetical protein
LLTFPVLDEMASLCVNETASDRRYLQRVGTHSSAVQNQNGALSSEGPDGWSEDPGRLAFFCF